jgi:hypothetical protein
VLGDIAQQMNKAAISASQKTSPVASAAVFTKRGPALFSAPFALPPGAWRNGSVSMSNLE